MTKDDTLQFYQEVIYETKTEDETANPPPKWVTTDRAGCMKSYETALGAKLLGTHGTLWGTYNGITHYYDHSRKYPQGKLNSLLFSRAHTIKTRAYAKAKQMLS